VINHCGLNLGGSYDSILLHEFTVTYILWWAVCFTRLQTGVYVVLLLGLHLERICAYNCDKGYILNAESVVRRCNKVLRTLQCSLCIALPAALGFACPVSVTMDLIGSS
jgi:hypothetical protein